MYCRFSSEIGGGKVGFIDIAELEGLEIWGSRMQSSLEGSWKLPFHGFGARSVIGRVDFMNREKSKCKEDYSKYDT